MTNIVRPRPPARPTPPTFTAPVAVAPSAGSAAPASRPTPPKRTLPKEAPANAAKQEVSQIVQGEARPKQEAPNVVIPAGLGAEEGKLGVRYAEAASDQVTMIQLHAMSLPEKHALWKRLNSGTPDHMFIPILRKDSYARQVVKEHPPTSGKPAVRGVMWCCYCAEWTIYEPFPYIGSDRCIGCGISTKDFYNRNANNLWKVEL